ncbi:MULTISPECIES: hypothetical protein [unclassified Myroides]|uniref:hypothetical protein n=1 Tax=unclassified Myroides TaxID=2642485 RepID=UPI003D2F7610
MSKLLFFLSLSFVFFSCESEDKKSDFDSIQNYDVYGSGFWNTAFVDAAGALGGAGSVASVAGWFGWTPAAPIAAGAVALGAVIGGEGASIAYANSYSVSLNDDYSFREDMIVSENYVDKVGFIHNQVVLDYIEKYTIYNEEVYFNFLEKNKDQYGFTEQNLISLNQIKEDIRSLKEDSHADVIAYTLKKLPKEIDQQKYIEFFKELGSLSVKEKAIDCIIGFESKELTKKEYTDEAKVLLGVYFSTLRYSLWVWNE